MTEHPWASAAVLTDVNGRILIVEPTYQDGWMLPGGGGEVDESPWQVCVREVAEELSLHLSSGTLIAVESRQAAEGRPVRLRFLFDCGVLSSEQIAEIELHEAELKSFRFAGFDEALALLSPLTSRRLRHVIPLIGTGRAAYLEDGEPV